MIRRFSAPRWARTIRKAVLVLAAVAVAQWPGRSGPADGGSEGRAMVGGVPASRVIEELLTRAAIECARTDPELSDYIGSENVKIKELEDLTDAELVDSLNFALTGERLPKFKDVRDAPRHVQDRARSVCAIISKSGLEQATLNGRKGWKVKTKTLREHKDFCGDAEFAKQRVATAIVGTGFLVDTFIVATSAHLGCQPDTFKFVFDFKLGNGYDGRGDPFIAADNVATGHCMKAWWCDTLGSDWGLIVLKEKVGRRCLTRSPKNAEFEDSVYVLGHPLGLPMKYAEGRVTENDHSKPFFKTNLYTFENNSGSPVLSRDLDHVLGLHDSNHELFKIGGCTYWIACAAIAGALCGDRCCGSHEVRISELDRMLERAVVKAERDIKGYIVLGDSAESFDPGALHLITDTDTLAFVVEPRTVVWLLSCGEWMDDRPERCRWKPYHIKPGQMAIIKRAKDDEEWPMKSDTRVEMTIVDRAPRR